MQIVAENVQWSDICTGDSQDRLTGVVENIVPPDTHVAIIAIALDSVI
jgi:hypothetical protein